MKIKSSSLSIIVISLVLVACRNPATLMPAPTARYTAQVDQDLESNQDSIEGALPALLQISIENAVELQLLRTMVIPDYSEDRVSQCNPAINPDGGLLAGACGDNPLPIWDVQTGELVQSLYDPPVHIIACAFSPDGIYIACGGFDRVVTIWETATGNINSNLGVQSAPIGDITFAPGGNTLASCSVGVFVDGSSQGEIRLWDIHDQQPLWIYSGSRDCLSLSFHPTEIAIAYGSIGGRVGILDTVSGELLVELIDSVRNIGSLAYSPSGLWLAAGSDDGHIYLWETSSYSLVAEFEAHTGYVNGVAISPDETLLVSGSHDGTVGVWDLQNHELITLLQGHERQVLRVAFHPDGTLIASISWDGTVRLWGIPQ